MRLPRAIWVRRGTAALQRQWQVWMRVSSCHPSLPTRMLVPTLAQNSSFSPHFYFELVCFFHCIALKKPLCSHWCLKTPKPSVKMGALVGRWGESRGRGWGWQLPGLGGCFWFWFSWTWWVWLNQVREPWAEQLAGSDLKSCQCFPGRGCWEAVAELRDLTFHPAELQPGQGETRSFGGNKTSQISIIDSWEEERVRKH